MSQWSNSGYGQGYSQQQGQYNTDSQQQVHSPASCVCSRLCYILDERLQPFCVRYRVNMAMAVPQRERSRYTLTNYKHAETSRSNVTIKICTLPTSVGLPCFVICFAACKLIWHWVPGCSFSGCTANASIWLKQYWILC